MSKRYEFIPVDTKDAMWDWNLKTGELYWAGNGYKTYFGYNIYNAIVPVAFKENCIHPEDKARVLTGLKKFLSDKSLNVWEDEYRFQKSDGTFAYVHDRGHMLFVSDNQPYRMIGSTHDITERKKAEIKLAESESRFRALVQNGSDMITILNAQGIFTYVSPSIDCVVGHDAKVLMGRNAFTFIHPDDYKSAYKQFKSLNNQREVQIRPFRFFNKTGELRWIEAKLTNLLDDPAVRGIVANARDITEKKMKDDEMRKLALIAKETNNAVIITDEHGKITWFNEAFTSITEYTSEEALGKTPGQLLQGKETDPLTIQYLHDKLRSKEPFDCEIVNYAKSGRKYWIRISGQCLYDGAEKCTRYFSIQTDITEKKLREKELEDKKIMKLREITEAVITAQENERAEITKELYGNVNQVLNVTKHFIEMAKTDKEQRHLLLEKSAGHLTGVINSITKLSNTLTIQNINDIGLCASIENIISEIMMFAPIKIEFTHLDVIEENLTGKLKQTIYRIVQEQLNNILKHAKASHAIIFLTEMDNNIELVISDDGQRIDTSTNPEGIGIASIMGRAESCQGTVVIQSEPGKEHHLKTIFSLKEEKMALEKISKVSL